MGSITDTVSIFITSHTHCADRTTRNDSLSYFTTLASYASDIATNFATPVYNQVAGERTAQGALQRTASPVTLMGTAAGGPCDLRAEVGIGFQPLATPLRYHLVGQDFISDAAILGAQSVQTWLTNLISRLAPVNIFPGGVNLV